MLLTILYVVAYNTSTLIIHEKRVAQRKGASRYSRFFFLPRYLLTTYLKCFKSIQNYFTKKEEKNQLRFWLKKTCVHGPKSFLHWLGCEWPTVSLLAWFSLAKWCCIALFSRLLVWIYRPTLTPSFYALIHPGKPAQAGWLGSGLHLDNERCAVRRAPATAIQLCKHAPWLEGEAARRSAARHGA